MTLNQSGTIAYNEWINLADRFPNLNLMFFRLCRITCMASSSYQIDPTIAEIVGACKSIVSNACLQLFKSHHKTMEKLWRRNYYEHIIRDERAYNNISNYILNNPSR